MTIVDATHFTVSATSGGPVFVQITASGSITASLVYNYSKCERDTGYLVEALIFDLGHGGNEKTTAAANSYYTSSGLAYITSNFGTQAVETSAAYTYLQSLIAKVLANTAPTSNYQTLNGISAGNQAIQNIDLPLTAESGSTTVAQNLLNIVITGLNAGIATAIPPVQKAQTTISVKTGTYFEVLPIIIPSNTAIVGDELRSTVIQPQPAISNLVNDKPKSIAALNRIKSLVPNLMSGTAVTGTSGNLQYLTATAAFAAGGTATITYVTQSAAPFIVGQYITNTGFTPSGFNGSFIVTACTTTQVQFALVGSLTGSVMGAISGQNTALPASDTGSQTAVTSIVNNTGLMLNIFNNGLTQTPTFAFTNPTGYNTGYLVGYGDGKAQIVQNYAFIKAEISAYLALNYTSVWNAIVQATCTRDVGYILDALQFDMTYGGNTQTLIAGSSYYSYYTKTIAASETTATVAAYQRLATIIGQIVQGQSVTPTSGNVTSQVTTGSAGSASAAAFAQARINDINYWINNGAAQNSTAVVVGSIGPSSTTMSVATITSGTLQAGMYVTGSGVSAGTFIVNQVTATNSASATTTATAAQGATSITVASATGIVAGQFIVATGIPAGTYVGPSYVANASTVPLVTSFGGPAAATQSLSTTAINFYTAGQTGNYTVSVSQTVGSNTVLTAVTTIAPDTTQTSLAAAVQTAYAAVVAKRTEVQSDTTVWVQKYFQSLSFNTATCYRDTGYIVDALAYDMVFGSNFSSITVARSYYRNTTSAQVVLTSQKTAEANAINFIGQKLKAIAASGAVISTQELINDAVGSITGAISTTATGTANSSNLVNLTSNANMYVGMPIVFNLTTVSTTATATTTGTNAITLASVTGLVTGEPIIFTQIPVNITLTGAQVTTNLLTITSTAGLVVGEVITFTSVTQTPSLVATASGTNLITLTSTAGLVIGEPIVFTSVTQSLNLTATSSSGNLLTVSSTAGLVVGEPIVFTANPVNTTATFTNTSTNQITLTSASGMVVGDPIVFTTVTQTPTLTGTTAAGSLLTLSSTTGLVTGETITFTSVTQTPTLTATSATGNLLTLSSSTGLVTGEPIVFTATTVNTTATATSSTGNLITLGTTVGLVVGEAINFTVVSQSVTMQSTSSSTNQILLNSTSGLVTGEPIVFTAVQQSTTLTAVATAGNLITLGSTAGMVVGEPITFTSNTVNTTMTFTAATNTITLASTSGLSNGMPIVFTAVTQTTNATATAVGGIVTLASVSGLVVGEYITLTGTAFGGLSNGGNYYITNINSGASQVTLSSSYGGSAITTSAASGTMTATAGAYFGNITSGTTYYITSIAGNNINVSLTYGGGAVAVTNGAGAWTVVAAGSAGGIVSGNTYYILSIGGNQITMSTTYGGSVFTPTSNATVAWNALSGANTFGNVNTGTTYYVTSISGNYITISTIYGGGTLTLSNAAGTWTGLAGGTLGGLNGTTTYYILSIPTPGVGGTITVSTSYQGSVQGLSNANGAWSASAGGALGNVSSGTTYYVTSIAGNQITVSTTYGGSNLTVVNAVGSWSSVAGGTLGGVQSGQQYFIASIVSNQITVSLTYGGASIGVTNANGSWTSVAGAYFGGINSGTTYYITAIASNLIQISTIYNGTALVLGNSNAAWTAQANGSFGNIISGTTYFIKSIPTPGTNGTITVSSTYGGGTFVVQNTNGSWPGIAGISGGTLGGVVSGTTYYILSISGNNITVSTTYNGTALTLTSTNGSWTSVAGATLGGVQSGTPYYILSINTGTSQITVSTSFGGSALSVTNANGSWTGIYDNSLGGLTSGQTYYILSINTGSNTVTVSTSYGGSVQAVTSAAGAWSVLAGNSLGGIVSGNQYWVNSVVGTTQITITSSYLSGTPVTLTGSSGAWTTVAGTNGTTQGVQTNGTITYNNTLTTINGAEILRANKLFLAYEAAAYTSATYGGTVTGTNATGNVVTTSSAHNLSIGDPIQFIANPIVTTAASCTTSTLTVGSTVGVQPGMTVTFSAGGFGGVSSSTTYYVLTVPSTTTMTISSSYNGSTLALTAGSGTMTVTIGAAIGGVVSGTEYYVLTVPSATTFTFTTTQAGTGTQTPFTLTSASGYMLVSYYYILSRCLRDTQSYIDAIIYDLQYPGNHKTRRATELYNNAVVGSQLSDMFRVRNGTGLRNCTLNGLSGTLTAANSYGTKRPTAGAFTALDPGFGPNDSNSWVTTRSHYSQNVTMFGVGCTGAKIDAALHAGGNKSMTKNDYTTIISDGIGVWCTGSGSLTELVSVFNYYGYAGYLAELGGRIRATNGNSSYGTYGVVAEGVDTYETPIYGNINNRYFNAVIQNVVTDVKNQILRFEYLNAGTAYTNAIASISGAGYNATAIQDEFRDAGMFETRLTDANDGNGVGGTGYVTFSNAAQGGDKTYVQLAATDTSLSNAYVGMRVQITGGTGVGQYGNIFSYSNGSKNAYVTKDSVDPITVTATSTTNNLLTVASTSQLYVGMPVVFPANTLAGVTNTLFGGLSNQQIYYVISANFSTTQFAVSTSAGGSAVTITSNNSSIAMQMSAVGWDHIVSGTTISTGLDLTSTYIIEPRINFSAPGYTTVSQSTGGSDSWSAMTYGNGSYVAIAGTTAGTRYSTNGTSWAAGGALPSSQTWTDIVYGGGAGATATAIIGGLGGSGAVLTAVLGVPNTTGAATQTQVASVTVVSGGFGYTTAPTIVFTPTNGGTGAVATCTVLNGAIQAVTVTIPGSGYNAAPKVTAATDRLTGITVNSWGRNYFSTPTVTIGLPAGISSTSSWTPSTVVTTSTYLQTTDQNIYLVTNGGTTGTGRPTFTSGSQANGTATLQYIATAATATASLISSSAGTTTGVATYTITTAGNSYISTPTITISDTTAKFVALSSNGTVTASTSSPGSAWVAGNGLPGNGGFTSITYGNGAYIAVGYGTTKVTSSTDGATWASNRVMPASVVLSSVTPTATGTNGATTITVGSATGIYAGMSVTGTGIGTLAIVANTYVTGSTTVPLTVANSGAVSGNATISQAWSAVQFGGSGYYVAIVAGGNQSAYSTSGVTWTAGGTLPSTAGWSSIAYGNNRFVAIATGSQSVAVSVDNGTTWSAATPGLPSSQTWTKIKYGAGLFVAIASSTAVCATSPDGLVWTLRAMPFSGAWSGIAFGNPISSTLGAQPIWAAVCNSSGTNAATIYTGTPTLGRVKVANNIVTETRVIEPGSGYPKGNVTATSASTNAFTVDQTINLVDSQPIEFNQAVGGVSLNTTYFIIGSSITATSFQISLSAGSATPVTLTSSTPTGMVYRAGPIVTQVDPNRTKTAPTRVRMGDGVLANPSFSNRGLNNTTATASVIGDGYADLYQPSNFVNVKNLFSLPSAGANVQFASIPNTWFKLVAITNVLTAANGLFTAQFQVNPAITVYQAPQDSDLITTRLKYSQVRLTGHDFLYIGTGNQTQTNYPNVNPSNAIQANQELFTGGGRVFFTSTDQDGNFNVGNLFGVQQSTGTATLNASAFNLAGLQSLQLGQVTLGVGSAVITQFSTDPYFTANSDNILPTQRAIKAYITAQIGGGSSSLNVNTLTAGQIYIANNTISNNSVGGGSILVTSKMNFTGGVDGAPVALGFFLQK